MLRYQSFEPNVGTNVLTSVPSGALQSRPSGRHSDPDNEDNNGSDGYMNADDLRDYQDQDPHVPPSSTANLRVGPYARFLANMPDWNDMSQGNYAQAFDALPRPMARPAPPGR